ncbi:hypothetical protein [Streptomyces achromogenes]|uniref:hypothetical protein n=1 Tax=Streptomyces achromogenes TaxID=67255 RepID=UPI0033E61997
MGLHRIALHHCTNNPASCTDAAEAGLLFEGILRQATTDHTGTRYDSHLHARLATDPRKRVPTPVRAAGSRCVLDDTGVPHAHRQGR